jgi:PAS domain S-box-containing protein
MSIEQGPPKDNIEKRALERVTDAIISVDEDFRYTYLNQYAQELLCKSESELIGKVIWDAFPETANTIAQEKIKKALEEQTELSYQRYNDTLDCWLEVRIFPAENGLSIFFTDITERVQRRKELEQYEWILENLPVAVGLHESGTDGGFEYVNDSLVEMFGLESKQETKQYSVQDFYADPEDRAELAGQLESNSKVTDYELELMTADDEQLWGSTTATLDTIDGEEYFLKIIQDISERKQYEQQLDELHEATRKMVSATSTDEVAEIMTDVAAGSLGFHTNGIHLYDESTESLVPMSVSDASQELIGDLPNLDEGVAWQAYQAGELKIWNDLTEAEELYNHDTEFESEVIIPVGDHGVFIASATTTDAFTQQEIVLARILANNAGAVLTQIETEQRLREREQKLERSEEFLDQTAKVAKVGGWEVDVETQELEWTDEVYRIHGLSKTDPPSLDEWIELYPQDQEKIKGAWNELVTNGEPCDLKVRIQTSNDSDRWVRLIGLAEYNDTKTEVVTVRGVIQDITEQKKREQRLTQQNERLNEFASIISHDLRNPLNVATARTTLLQQVCDDTEASVHLDPLESSLDRMEEIIEGTLLLARNGESISELNHVHIVDSLGNCWGNVTTENASLEIKDEFTLLGDADRLKHVFENLFRNATEHGGDGLTVTVGQMNNGFYVEDDGKGIPEDKREQIFETGYSSDPQGTGFGLTIVKRIVEAHGWDISLTEGSDGGARFEFDGVEFV